MTERRKRTPFKIENIPKALTSVPQWVAWSGHMSMDGKLSKRPINARTGKYAKTNESATWSKFDQAVSHCRENSLRGVGFVFSEDDPFVGIDLDDCLSPKSGEIQSWAREIIDRFDSYTEITPSGRGVHIFVKGSLPGGGRKKGNIEVYDRLRFFTVTGNHFEHTPLEICQRDEEIREFYGTEFESKPLSPESTDLLVEADDDRIIEKAMAAQNGEKFRRLWNGDHSSHPSHSEADMALCRMLAFWTNKDPERINHLFRQSGLYRSKWDEKHYGDGRTYGDATIQKAIQIADEGYCVVFEKDTSEKSQLGFKPTDLGNAERLVARHGKDIRYCHAWKYWLAWDGIRWSIDRTDSIKQKGKETVRKIYREADQVNDPDRRKEVAKHAMSSESDNRIKAMISLAQTEPGIPVTPEQLDRDPWLLTCLNGTIDLRSGCLLPHQRGHLITQLVPAGFEQDAISPLWNTFLERIMNENQNLISFLQRAVGYSLTGDTGEQCLFILYGTGANGKSTFLQAVSSMLGDYAKQTPTETLLVKPKGAIPNDVARLKGARLVTASEAEGGQRMAEGLIKQMTGSDKLSARFLHKEWFEFDPTHKIFLATNHKPVIRGTDPAIWRRIKLIPFEVTIPEKERDTQLLAKLKEELPGILAWAVKGCLEWQDKGLGVPDEVVTATDTYRNEMDVLGEFLMDCCVEYPSAKAKSKDLYETYERWCERNGDQPLKKRSFGLKLQERGFMPIRVGRDRSRGWGGIGLQTQGYKGGDYRTH